MNTQMRSYSGAHRAAGQSRAECSMAAADLGRRARSPLGSEEKRRCCCLDVCRVEGPAMGFPDVDP